MKFSDFINESKEIKLTGKFKHQLIYGKLKVIIYVEDVKKELEDITTFNTYIDFEDGTWELKLNIPKEIDNKKIKKIITKEIDDFVSKVPLKDFDDYFYMNDDDELEVIKGSELEISLSNEVLK